MKIKLALWVITLVSLPCLADQDAETIGKQFCNKIIDVVSPGSNHVLVCLDTVEKLKDVQKDREGVIRAICERAPNFPYASGSLSKQECLKSAVQKGYIKKREPRLRNERMRLRSEIVRANLV